MEKMKILQEKSMALRVLLQMHEKSNADAMLLLQLLTPSSGIFPRGESFAPFTINMASR